MQNSGSLKEAFDQILGMEGFKIFTIVDKMPSIPIQSTQFDFVVTCILLAKLCWEHRLTIPL